MTKALRVADYLGHILQAIGRIGRYTDSLELETFLENELVQDAVIRNIEIIGEAANNIQRFDSAYAARHHHVPWQVMYTMRNRVSHGYDTVDLEVVWNTVQRDLPYLLRQVQALASGSDMGR